MRILTFYLMSGLDAGYFASAVALVRSVLCCRFFLISEITQSFEP